VEGNIQGILRVQNLEFKISGRCDGRGANRLRHRIDYVEDGLELIDYKSTRAVKLPNPDEIDLQIGLYYLALFAAISSKLAEIEFGVPANWRQGKF
jgi:putative RecB family exonuclease